MSLTGGILLWVFIGLIIYTGVARKFRLPTISMTMRDTAWRYNNVAFLSGILFGHWWVNLQNPIADNVGIVLIPWLVYLGVDIYWNVKDLGNPWYRWPILHALLGILAGALLWGQGHGSGPI